jgi:anhydro-N-acetylmuramic acid kinase
MGVMTGTSLDGVDLCVSKFLNDGYEIIAFECIPFPEKLKSSLSRAEKLSALSYFQLEQEYSEFLTQCINECHIRTNKVCEFVGVHGQTVFHNPSKQLTTQMLDGGLIASRTGLMTVCDFRRSDVALGGQGAPLVPIGDHLLFSEYAACLNLGGFANVSYEAKGERLAYDICPVNYVLNRLALRKDKEYDDKGRMAESGHIDEPTLEKLSGLSYYHSPLPKSLGREWVEQHVDPLLENLQPEVALRTMCEHIAEEISNALPKNGKVLITGGGAYNDFLISLIRSKQAQRELVLPEKQLLEGKEALLFAFLAKLRLERKTNVLRSVTGASRDSSSGAVFLP